MGQIELTSLQIHDDSARTPSPQANYSNGITQQFGTLYGSSPAMRGLYEILKRVAPTDTTVFIVGESGSGKELVATTIHQISARAVQPFIAVNCSAIPANLIEAELFGYEKGSFTGAARQHKGLFERAKGGTLFLDEITEMPLELQATLLRALESRKFRRVGGDREIESDARIIAATNYTPTAAVRAKKLREDLLYRLSVFPVSVPALQERGNDII
ncbi:MAG TPA: sigma-54 factor interaction domain-containing protein, partial [Burkholderiales bacterium]|nr:sigma-54 factor interaction domain-containing protein [Burkholderiales bacterium]